VEAGVRPAVNPGAEVEFAAEAAAGKVAVAVRTMVRDQSCGG